jgi:hypothetical protein
MSAPNPNYKTTMCVYWETGCPRQATCIFAHSAEELRARQCPHGARCRFDRRRPGFDASRRPCGFFHPGEVITVEEVFKRATEFSVAKPVAIPGSIVKSTKLCLASECCCSKAHKAEELAPMMCKRGAHCHFDRRRADFDPKRRPCNFFHPGEKRTPEEIYKRAFEETQFEAAKQPKIEVPQFIVRFSNDDDEEEEEEELVPEEPKVSAWGDDDEEAAFEKAMVF